MQKLLEMIAKSLVDDPDSVVVDEGRTNYGTLLKLKVAKPDMGKIIGKQGKRAKALRTIMKAVSIRNNTSVTVEIQE
ncbi:MAG: KH domain-containing protein [Clostridiales bacterium]|nr:KH domain-containing protein [Clostridiales bacterium]